MEENFENAIGLVTEIHERAKKCSANVSAPQTIMATLIELPAPIFQSQMFCPK
jgi:hypothetical protein